MPAIEIKPDIFWVGVNDRTTDLFEGVWPVSREGVSYNSYLIRDEKKVIVDLVKAFKSDEFFDQMDAVMPLEEVDYVIINHMEPDHTGVLRTLKRIAPKVKIFGTEKMKNMLEAYYGITENVQIVKDGDTLDTGKYTLKFVSTPFVHWPETMMTYEVKNKILFSCDAFGSYGALRGGIFDDECKDHAFFEQEGLRYYVNIVANFSKAVLKAIDKLADVPVEVIAPSHGLVWRCNPGRIVELYTKWAGYMDGHTEPGITLLYSSMYGNTEEMMNAVSQGIAEAGVDFQVFDAARTHVSYILPALWQNRGVIIGAPTYEGRLFPPMADVLNMAAIKHVRHKTAAYFGSYGWSKGALKNLEQMIEPLKWNITEKFEFHGGVTRERLSEAEAFGKRFALSIAE